MKDQLINKLNHKAILLVDDEADILRSLTWGLKRLRPNYRVATAADGLAAWALLQQQSFALLVTDYDMPVMDGLQLAWQVRQCSPDLPIILMSGGPWADLEAEAKVLRATFLVKPFTLARLKTEIIALRL
jgi:CheY-like chemotaxis protein